MTIFQRARQITQYYILFIIGLFAVNLSLNEINTHHTLSYGEYKGWILFGEMLVFIVLVTAACMAWQTKLDRAD